jgi:hypothetical protein
MKLDFEAGQVFDANKGFRRAVPDRPPWEMKVAGIKLEQTMKPTGRLSGNTDWAERELQTLKQYGTQSAPVAVKTRKTAPTELKLGGLTQAGTNYLDKLESLRTRQGLNSLEGDRGREECEGGHYIVLPRNLT